MRKLMLSLAGFRSAFGVMSAYRDVAAVVTGPMGVSGRDTMFMISAKSMDSHTWQNILKSRDVLSKGIEVNINNGHSTSFWFDVWLDSSRLVNLATRSLSKVEISLLVASYCDDTGNWDFDFLS
ncbi:Uncharacterized protein TCM_001933 [Theobroma cacao]|uniref:Reverse transcriptase zinc-binding domain-containing protein n=1 Tax=Theobroma cacao TaxID=3641 RepID=A0A061DKX3_THECC|nr:Uncharacterized protein TCM_001933 [Theobroma cacao]